MFIIINFENTRGRLYLPRGGSKIPSGLRGLWPVYLNSKGPMISEKSLKI
jgi:hypothetical protein